MWKDGGALNRRTLRGFVSAALLVAALGLGAQEACGSPVEPQPGPGLAAPGASPGLPQAQGGGPGTPGSALLPPLPPAPRPENAEEAQIWSLILLSSSWTLNPVEAKGRAVGVIYNQGLERVRGAGLQAIVKDGAGAIIASAWALGPTVYLEPGGRAEISLELVLPLSKPAALVIFETVAVMGTCGW